MLAPPFGIEGADKQPLGNCQSRREAYDLTHLAEVRTDGCSTESSAVALVAQEPFEFA